VAAVEADNEYQPAWATVQTNLETSAAMSTNSERGHVAGGAASFVEQTPGAP